MLDLNFLRENLDLVAEAAGNKGESLDLDRFHNLDKQRRSLIGEVESLKGEVNAVSKQIGELKRAGEPADETIERMAGMRDEIKSRDRDLKKLEDQFRDFLLTVPNLPHSSAPVGPDADSNLFVRQWGDKPAFDFQPLDHYQIGERLDLFDFPGATKLSGSGFALFRGRGARLERALISFMIDLHVNKHGYTELSPPFLATRPVMTGTGQLPKLEEDMYRIEQDDLFLIPTAEVPLTNLHREETIPEKRLPICYTAYTPCFRREAGSYGRDTRGLTRVHQFDKVEMVKFTRPEDSYNELESLVEHAEDVLKLLQLPYRVMLLATGDLSFAAAKCYDLEVWSPAQQKYLEVSSCSNFEDFQARRAGIRYKPAAGGGGGGKTRFVHTLNGSGLALPRTVIALLENNQTADGKVRLPEALKPYMDGLDYLD
jgi:seryl-tRNA synthetase